MNQFQLSLQLEAFCEDFDAFLENYLNFVKHEL